MKGLERSCTCVWKWIVAGERYVACKIIYVVAGALKVRTGVFQGSGSVFISIAIFLFFYLQSTLPPCMIELVERELKALMRKKDAISSVRQALCSIKMKKTERGNKYPPLLRQFAITIHFYSARAYDYIRETFKDALPSPSTLKAWYRTINGRPGFTEEAFSNLTEVVSQKKNRNEKIVANLCLDEISIKPSAEFVNGENYGFAYGGPQESNTDGQPLASHILTFMIVALNSSWKLPIGYFPIHSFSGTERGTLLETCLQLLHETGVIVESVTFDGAVVNKSMVTALGANFDYFSPNFKPWFDHPITKQPVLVFWDACHMLKLIRNALGDKGPLYHPSSAPTDKIDWGHISQLNARQEVGGLRLGNKLTMRHVKYQEAKMNVRLATQALSDSVSKGLYFLKAREPAFRFVAATADFCKVMNDAFDILNCRSLFAKNPFQKPLNDANEGKLRARAEEIIHYIEKLELDIVKCVPVKKAKKRPRRRKLKNKEHTENIMVGEEAAIENVNKEEENTVMKTPDTTVQNEGIIVPKKRKYVRKSKSNAENVIVAPLKKKTVWNRKKKEENGKIIPERSVNVLKNIGNIQETTEESRENGANILKVSANVVEDEKNYSRKTTNNVDNEEIDNVSANCKNVDATEPETGTENEEIKIRTNILKSERYTGFLGMIISLRNIFELYKKCRTHGMKYLLSYKVLQDHIENFFSAIRAKGGFNDNPTCQQFESSYKRLLVHAEIAASSKSNYSLNTTVSILNCSSEHGKRDDRLFDLTEDIDFQDDVNEFIQDHDYRSTAWQFDEFNESSITYIAGFVSHALKKKTSCHICRTKLTGNEANTPHADLIVMKNRGRLVFPSVDVIRVCRSVERIFRMKLSQIHESKFPQMILCLVLRDIAQNVFQSPDMDDHILAQAILEEHRTELIRAIVRLYLKIRMNFEGKVKSQPKSYVRRTLHKLIHFKESRGVKK